MHPRRSQKFKHGNPLIGPLNDNIADTIPQVVISAHVALVGLSVKKAPFELTFLLADT